MVGLRVNGIVSKIMLLLVVVWLVGVVCAILVIVSKRVVYIFD